MHCYRDIVCVGHVRDLSRFTHAADPGEVRRDDIDGLFLEQAEMAVLAVDVLAGDDGRGRRRL
ncbi:hypothetical protein C450_06495 [Halococcus salifodinae DSM 8989]|uniref:Uncharacterized protein n=1 Tax=Halococcus salifodinae DSM 8989 TaxID=1227456 RepID=M0N8K4_9EURY|nr:hypothetical protein C450_06495 [Halococcus salifodinae DSM 8989]